MKNLARLLGGSLAGAALLTFAFAVTPAAANPTGFCSETDNYVCCCSQNPDGSINDCTCMPKTP